MGLHQTLTLTLTLTLILCFHSASPFPASSSLATSLQPSPPSPADAPPPPPATPQASAIAPETKRKKKKNDDDDDDRDLPLDRLRPGSSSLPGRRPHQEDRVSCFPRLQISPARGAAGNGSSAGNVAGLFAVFDGHLGDSASSFAAESIRERFLHHARFSRPDITNDAAHFDLSSSSSSSSASSASSSAASSLLMSFVLQKALRDAIIDIDSNFRRKYASHRDAMASGTTAAVALKVGDQLLVANVGDSKVFLCSSCERDSSLVRRDESHWRERRVRRRFPRSRNTEEEDLLKSGLCVREVSSDHHPGRPEERLRIEASGGFVTTTGSSARVNGMLAVSRSIGDAELKKFGVIADPEMSGWFPISEQDKFLVLASDGIFEKLTPQEVCSVIHGLASNHDIQEVMADFLKQKGSAGVVALPLPPSTDQGGCKDLNATHSLIMEPLSTDHIADVNACHIGMDISTSLEVWNAHKANAMLSKDTDVSCGNPYVDSDVCYSDDGGSTSMEPWNVGSASELHHATSVARLMAQVLTELAYQAGSMDNLSVLVVPLRSVSNG